MTGVFPSNILTADIRTDYQRHWVMFESLWINVYELLDQVDIYLFDSRLQIDVSRRRDA